MVIAGRVLVLVFTVDRIVEVCVAVKPLAFVV